jgi:hypothetical protein
MCGLLEEESLRFWRLWMDQFVDKWKADCKPELETEDELKNLLNLFLVG